MTASLLLQIILPLPISKQLQSATSQSMVTEIHSAKNVYYSQKRESRIGRINLTYRFGNSAVKARRQRKDASQEESGRLKQKLIFFLKQKWYA